MLLEVVAFVWNVSDHFDAVGQTNLCNFADGRIRLLGGSRHYLHANAAFERVALQRRCLGLVGLQDTGAANELVDCRHVDVKGKLSKIDFSNFDSSLNFQFLAFFLRPYLRIANH